MWTLRLRNEFTESRHCWLECSRVTSNCTMTMLSNLLCNKTRECHFNQVIITSFTGSFSQQQVTAISKSVLPRTSTIPKPAHKRNQNTPSFGASTELENQFPLLFHVSSFVMCMIACWLRTKHHSLFIPRCFATFSNRNRWCAVLSDFHTALKWGSSFIDNTCCSVIQFQENSDFYPGTAGCHNIHVEATEGRPKTSTQTKIIHLVRCESSG